MDLGADAFDGRHGVETAALGAPIVPKTARSAQPAGSSSSKGRVF